MALVYKKHKFYTCVCWKTCISNLIQNENFADFLNYRASVIKSNATASENSDLGGVGFNVVILASL